MRWRFPFPPHTPWSFGHEEGARFPFLSWAVFWGYGCVLLGFALFLSFGSPAFSYDVLVRDMPIAALVVLLMAAGGLFLLLRLVVGTLPAPSSFSLWFWGGMVGIGLLARVIVLFSEPILEDDYQRYLWDGAVIAHGLNPYLYSPESVLQGAVPLAYQDLGMLSGLTLERVNHSELRTVYPIGAELLFGFAHKISPFSLLAWRSLLLVFELLSLLLLFLICRHINRSPLWLVLYWWNPLVIKEVINSAHMEGALMSFVLLGVYLSLTSRFIAASAALSVAASIKLWPALLLPLVWRQLWGRPFALFGSLLLALLIGGVVLLAFLSGGLDDSSGLVAYGQRWKTNSAFFPLFEQGVAGLFQLISALGLPRFDHAAPYTARGLIGLFLVGVVIYLCRLPRQTETRFASQQQLQHFFLLSLLIFLLSPAQFPWYCLWVMPFLVFYPLWGLSLLVPLMALYYVGFSLMSAGVFDQARLLLALLIWLPVWGGLWAERRQALETPHAP